MAIDKTTLTKKTGNTTDYIYPKTSADIVEYTPDQSIKSKLDEIEDDNKTISDDVDDIIEIIGDDTSGIIKDINGIQEKISAMDGSIVSTSEDGLMSAMDKNRLDSIPEGATNTIIDIDLDSTSKNPVRNNVINGTLLLKANSDHTHITVNGHTVESDVPANAVFTDTVYELVTDNTPGLMSTECKILLDNVSNKIINDSVVSDNMTYSSDVLDRDYYSKTEIDAIFSQIGWVGTLEDYKSLSIINPRMIYTTINSEGIIKRFLGDKELKVNSSTSANTLYVDCDICFKNDKNSNSYEIIPDAIP